MRSAQKWITLVKFEFLKWFVSPLFYTVATVFFLLMGLIFVFALEVYSRFPQDEILMIQLFKAMWLPLLFIVPILTAKTTVGEKVDKTFNLNLLLPVSPIAIVLSKFFVLITIYLAFWLGIVLFPYTAIHYIASLQQLNNICSFEVLTGGVFFAVLLGFFAISLGLLIGIVVRSYGAALSVYFVSMFTFLISGQMIKKVANFSFQKEFLSDVLYNNLNVFFQLEDFCRGVYDSRVICGYLSLTVLFLTMSCIFLRGAR